MRRLAPGNAGVTVPSIEAYAAIAKGREQGFLQRSIARIVKLAVGRDWSDVVLNRRDRRARVTDGMVRARA